MAEGMSLEQRADKLYQFIYDYLKEHAVAPSHREMCTELKCSTETLAQLLNSLEKSEKGLHRVRGLKRRMWVPIGQMQGE